MAFEKVDSVTIKEVTDKEILYRYDNLLEQKKSWQSRKAYMIDKADSKIAEIDSLIAECVKLGLKEPVKEV